MSLGYICFCILSWMFNWKATGSIWILLPLLLQNMEIEPGKANTWWAANWHCFSVLEDLLKTLTLHNTFNNYTRKGKTPVNTMPGSSEKVPCTDSGFECNLGREYCFTFIPTQSFLHQPYMIYSIFIANISMKLHFVQTEAMKKELEWFGDGWRRSVSCKILSLSQVRKTQFQVGPAHSPVHGGGNSWRARARMAYGMWPCP